MKNKFKLVLSITLTFLFTNFLAPAFSKYSSKPLFIEISTQWCGACKVLKPTLEELKREYGSEVTFITLDATNEETLKEADKIAEGLGITDFFNNSKNAFPRIGIFCSSSNSPDHNLLGARGKEEYTNILNELIYGRNACSLPESNYDKIADSEQQRPKEIVTNERPELIVNSGRPDELSFWRVGEQIPISAYFQFVRLPKCEGNALVCANYSSNSPNSSKNKNEDGSSFKPWDPNATRNEKGFDSVEITKIKG